MVRLEQDEQDRRRRMIWDDFEARVRDWLVITAEEKPLEHGQAIAWMLRDNDRANGISAVHHYAEKGRTFCHLTIPPVKQHLPVLSFLHECKRCRVMSARAVRYAKMAHLKVSA